MVFCDSGLRTGAPVALTVLDEGKASETGTLARCPPGYVYLIERRQGGFGLFVGAFAFGMSNMFGTAKPTLGDAMVTVKTPDGAVTVFSNLYDEAAGKHVVKLVRQTPAPV